MSPLANVPFTRSMRNFSKDKNFPFSTIKSLLMERIPSNIVWWTHIWRLEFWHILAKFSVQDITDLAQMSVKLNASKQDKPVLMPSLLWPNSVLCGCRTEVCTCWLSIKGFFQLSGAACILYHLTNSRFKPTKVHQIILMLHKKPLTSAISQHKLFSLKGIMWLN